MFFYFFICKLFKLVLSYLQKKSVTSTKAYKSFTNSKNVLSVFYLWEPLIMFFFFLLCSSCVISDWSEEAFVNWWFWSGVQDLLREGEERRSRWLKEEEEEQKNMGHNSVWIILLCLSLSHQSVTAQAEGRWWRGRTPAHSFYFSSSHVVPEFWEML